MALEGTLQDMSLPDLFQVFRMGSKTGILLLVAGSERGVLYVLEGRPIDAVVVRGAERVVLAGPEEAVIRMLLWDDASFVFRHDLGVRQRLARICRDSEWLVMESLRRRDDPTRILPYHRISLDTQLQLSPLPSSAESGVSLDVNQWPILSQISSYPSLRRICEVTSIAEEQVIRIVAELLSLGLVEIMPPSMATPRRPRPAALSQKNGLEPGLAAVSASAINSSGAEVVGRGLLDAIMRRVREL